MVAPRTADEADESLGKTPASVTPWASTGKHLKQRCQTLKGSRPTGGGKGVGRVHAIVPNRRSSTEQKQAQQGPKEAARGRSKSAKEVECTKQESGGEQGGGGGRSTEKARAHQGEWRRSAGWSKAVRESDRPGQLINLGCDGR